MREVFGAYLFTYPADAIVIPVNWTTKKNGDAVMGAGVAKQAAERWSWLPQSLGRFIRERPKLPCLSGLYGVGEGFVCLPTKRDWRDPSDLVLIASGAHQLVEMAENVGLDTVALPRLGCGEKTGRLQWADVKPVLASILDDRFTVVHLESRP